MQGLKRMEFVDEVGPYHNSTNVPYDMDISPALGKVLQRTAPRLLQQVVLKSMRQRVP